MRTSSIPFVAIAALLAIQGPAAAACSWKLVSAPGAGSSNTLTAVSGSSTSDVWAVGTTNTPSSQASLAEHFDGKSWSVTTTPDPFGAGNILRGIAAVSPTDAWAVGVGINPSGPPAGFLLNWNGKTWSYVVAPTIGGRYIFLNRVSALNASDIWAIGGSVNQSGTCCAPLAMHYNGKKWAIVPTPNLGTYGTTMTGIAIIAANDVWAIGDTLMNPSGTSYTTFAMHWNGKKWAIFPTPNANTNDNVFNALVAVASNDVWAVGDYWTGSIFNTLTEHWNGKAWSIVSSPNIGKTGNGLYGVGAVSSKAVWAVGEIIINGGATGSSLSLKWNGAKWAQIKSPNLKGATVDYFGDATGIPGSNTVWAVGEDFNPSNGSPEQPMTASDACAGLDRQDDVLPTARRFVL